MKLYSSYNTVRNDTNSLLKYDNSTPINRGSIDSMDNYVKNLNKDLEKVIKRSDIEDEDKGEDGIITIDDESDIEDIEKLSINKKTPFDINPQNTYPFGFQGAPYSHMKESKVITKYNDWLDFKQF